MRKTGTQPRVRVGVKVGVCAVIAVATDVGVVAINAVIEDIDVEGVDVLHLLMQVYVFFDRLL